MAYKLKNREVCWDTCIVDTMEGAVRLQMHRPEKKNVALVCNGVWENIYCGWPGVLKVGDTYRLYYRTWGNADERKEGFCVAFSEDGKTFEKRELALYELGGTMQNNVFFADRSRSVDNFSVHYDENPDCPPDEKFKGLSLVFHRPPLKQKDGSDLWTELGYYKSADGIRFEFVRILDVPGVFDTYNVVFWDKEAEEYKMYIRDFHNKDGSRSSYEPTAAMEVAYRDIRYTHSKDFVHWSAPEIIQFSDGIANLQHYTNQIYKYPRAEHMFIGVPARYKKPELDDRNFHYLPQWNGGRKKLLEAGRREGAVVTDCVLITSRDGFHFDRCNEAFLAPEMENESNWRYGEGYTSYRTVETVSDQNPAVTELSFYMPEGERRTKETRMIRYTLRLDGYFSWHGDYAAGTVTTKPVVFEGDSLEINFATSALGHVRIVLCDEDENALDGYDSGELFGNSLSRQVEFEKPLANLSGKPVRLKIELKDADLYSFAFHA